MSTADTCGLCALARHKLINIKHVDLQVNEESILVRAALVVNMTNHVCHFTSIRRLLVHQSHHSHVNILPSERRVRL